MNYNHGGNLFQMSKEYSINPEDIIDFSNNLNPLGISEELLNIIRNNIERIKYFPEIDSSDLSCLASQVFKLNNNNFLFTNGTTQLIYILFKNILNTESKILLTIPNYSDYSFLLENFKKVNYINLHENDEIKIDLLDKILNGSKYDYAIICNPNNPLGYLIKKGYIESLIKKYQSTIFIIDESYMDFAKTDESLIKYVEAGNLIIIKSLTKILSAPGLRIGMCISSDAHIKNIMNYLPPWSVNPYAQLAAEYYFKNFFYLKNKTSVYIETERRKIINNFNNISDLRILETKSNIYTVKILLKNITSKDLQRRLLKMYNILIRDCSNIKGLTSEYFRCSIKSKDDNDKLLKAIENEFPNN